MPVLTRCILLLVWLLPLPATAALAVGERAPDFSLPMALAGEKGRFSLAEARRRGPVVVYFYPAAFTPGCSIETKLFADAMPAFKAAGASVIGISGDDLATLRKFSLSHCRSRFPVAADSRLEVAAAYDAGKAVTAGQGYAERISYVIAPNGKVLFVHDAAAPQRHVSGTLAAVQQYRKRDRH